MATKEAGGKTGDQSQVHGNDADKNDLKRGTILLTCFIVLFVVLSGIYIYAHQKKSTGLFSPKAIELGMSTVSKSNAVLSKTTEDVLGQEEIFELVRLSDMLAVIAPQIGKGIDYSAELTKINAELGNDEAHRAILIPLFGQISNRIEADSGNYFWTGSIDRWIEFVFWTIFGTLAFLMSEIKKFYPRLYQENLNPDDNNVAKKRNFVKFTPWYAVNLFRGPFIALVILLAVSSISFEAMGITIDVNSAPFFVWIVLAAILGFYARLAEKQLDLIAAYFLKAAWEKTNPSENSKGAQQLSNNNPETAVSEGKIPAKQSQENNPTQLSEAKPPAEQTDTNVPKKKKWFNFLKMS
jgi:hypothetical protein